MQVSFSRGLGALLTMAAALLLLPFPAMGAGASADTISAPRAFVELPETVLELLPRSTRLDMLDYFAAVSVWRAPNAMEGESHLDGVTPSMVSVTLTPVSALQIKTLRRKDGSDLVMTIYTVGSDTQARDSEIRFFTPSMQELPRDRFFKVPELQRFFDIPRGSATSLKELEGMIPFPTFDCRADPSSPDVTVRLTVGDYINMDDYNIMKLFLRPGVVYSWDGSRFRPAKK